MHLRGGEEGFWFSSPRFVHGGLSADWKGWHQAAADETSARVLQGAEMAKELRHDSHSLPFLYFEKFENAAYFFFFFYIYSWSSGKPSFLFFAPRLCKECFCSVSLSIYLSAKRQKRQKKTIAVRCPELVARLVLLPRSLCASAPFHSFLWEKLTAAAEIKRKQKVHSTGLHCSLYHQRQRRCVNAVTTKNPSNTWRICPDEEKWTESRDDMNPVVLWGWEDDCSSAHLRFHLKHTGQTRGWNKGSVSVRSLGARLKTRAWCSQRKQCPIACFCFCSYCYYYYYYKYY